MRNRACLLAVALLIALPASAQTSGLQDPLIDRMIGDWLLQGTIDGQQVTHDVTFERVLGHRYVRFHEIAREQDATGAPAYEAIVFIGWDTANEHYTCLWLDSTSGEGLSAAYGDSIGHAVAEGDSLPFEFRFPNGSLWHTTFSYDRDSDTWEWHMIGEGDDMEPFARVTLSRK